MFDLTVYYHGPEKRSSLFKSSQYVWHLNPQLYDESALPVWNGGIIHVVTEIKEETNARLNTLFTDEVSKLIGNGITLQNKGGVIITADKIKISLEKYVEN